ncbi:RNA polymerase sigma factor [Mucilaginibacter sp. AW1-3]
MNIPEQLSDEALFKLLKNNDIKAFDELYSRYWSTLFSAAYRRVKSREIAEEIVQEYFVSLWKNRDKTVINTCVAAYFKSSIRYIVIAYYQKECLYKNYTESVMAVSTGYDNSTTQEVELRDLVLNLEEGISLLPDKCRSVFELSRKQFKSNKQIALSLGISEKTVENHLTKALKILKVHLKEFITILFICISAGK